MKYLVMFDFEHTSMMDAIKKYRVYYEEKNKNPEKYPDTPLPAHIMYKGKKGCAVWEADEAQVARKVAVMLPEVKYTLIPIFDAGEFIKTYMEVKK